MNIKNHGGLLTVEENGQEQCLGYLMNFGDKGIFSPNGKVELTPEQVEAHNVALSNGEIYGLDENCEVGQKGTFYYCKGKVTTFLGDVVSDQVKVSGKCITFKRKGKVFAGRLQKDADCFNFRRTL